MGTSAPEPRHEYLDVEIHRHRARRPVSKTDVGPNPAVAIAASRLVLAGGDVCVVRGYAIAESTGAAGAQLRLRDGKDNTGEVLARINLAAGESDRHTFPGSGLEVFTGRVFLELLGGQVEGVIYWSP